MSAGKQDVDLVPNVNDLQANVTCRSRRLEKAVYGNKKEPTPSSCIPKADLETRDMMVDIALNELACHLDFERRARHEYRLGDIPLRSPVGPEIHIATVMEWFSPKLFAETFFPARLMGMPVGCVLLRFGQNEHAIRIVREGERERPPGSRIGISGADDFLG